jgi:hypothetical protein
MKCKRVEIPSYNDTTAKYMRTKERPPTTDETPPKGSGFPRAPPIVTSQQKKKGVWRCGNFKSTTSYRNAAESPDGLSSSAEYPSADGVCLPSDNSVEATRPTLSPDYVKTR